ncbi:beta-1,3-galactosyltransferase 1-like isoform X2 [Watersipora subatra]
MTRIESTRIPTVALPFVLQTCQLLYSVFLLCMLSIADGKPSRQVVNPHPFQYSLNNPNLCDNQPSILIWIHTAPAHHRLRTLVRESWANPAHIRDREVSLVFFLGMPQNSSIQHMLEYESDTYQDIVQESFIDSYRNLTYKAILGCKWTSTYCESAKVILKADDDMVVDIYLLFRHLDNLQSHGKVNTNTILCDVWYQRKPQRDEGKWKISMAEYPGDTYPPYCPGLGLVMTRDIIPKLYRESFYEPFFWVDDVYFTGLLAKTVNVTFEQLAATVHFGPSKLIHTNTMFENEYQWMFYHIQQQSIFRTVWRMLQSREIRRQSHQTLVEPYR